MDAVHAHTVHTPGARDDGTLDLGGHAGIAGLGHAINAMPSDLAAVFYLACTGITSCYNRRTGYEIDEQRQDLKESVWR
jgi:hypothetical protein